MANILTPRKELLAQLDAQPGMWENMAVGLVSGAAQGATAALGAVALSDERMKTDIQDATESQLDELLTSVGAQTYTYKGEPIDVGLVGDVVSVQVIARPHEDIGIILPPAG
jgi:hypothetical protein